MRPLTFRIREEGRGAQETCFLVKVGIRALFLEVGNREGRAYKINQMPLQIYSAQHRFTQKEGRKGEEIEVEGRGEEEVHSGRKHKFIWEINDHIIGISIQDKQRVLLVLMLIWKRRQLTVRFMTYTK